jgi:hypothetical protein
MVRSSPFDESRKTRRAQRGAPEPSAARRPHARPLRLEPLEDRRLLAPLIGIDFGTGAVPTNWTQITSVGPTASPTTSTNLIDETGAATAVDLTISTSFAGGANSSVFASFNSSTLPQHTQSIADVANFVIVAGSNGINSFDGSFNELKPGRKYEIYVFAHDWAGRFDNQTLTISGGDSPIVYTQFPISGHLLWVNDQVGSSSRSLASYAQLMTPTAAGAINVKVQMNAGSSALVLAGLAIRESMFDVNSNSDVDDIDSDNDVTTLREAIRLANAMPGADRITFDASLSGQQIDLSGSEYEITEALTIEAEPLAQNVTINAHGQSRIFNITAASGDFTLTGVTLTGGGTTGTDDPDLGQMNHRGGAIRSMTSGLLTLKESAVSGNSTTGNNAVGGGIYAAGPVSLTRVTLSGNSTSGGFASGGALYAKDALTLTHSTVSGNSTAGADAHGGALFVDGALTLTQCTVANNHAAGTGGIGGGVFQTETGDNDPLSISGSIIAGNTAALGSPDLAADAQSVTLASSVTYSLIGDTSGSEVTPATGAGNLLNVNPLIGPLADNGGPTPTHALLPGSPAFDANASPVAFYRFEDTSGTAATDLIGAHPGALQGGVMLNQPGATQVGGKAASFDGVNDYISVAALFSASQLSGASYSVELWFNPNSNDVRATLVALTTAAGHVVMVERIEDGGLRFVNRIPAATGLGDDLSSIYRIVKTGQWNHLAAVRDGAAMRIYLNGAQVASLSNATGNLPADLRLTIGRLSDTQSSRYFAGKLDDVAIYNRALSAGEVALHATRGVVDQRGLFGVVDGNGTGGVQTDIGAYEAQVKPSADFDGNTVVDGHDFLLWQRGLDASNATRAQGNSDDDQDADHSDLAAWKVHFGATSVTSEAASEPAAATSAPSAATVRATTLDALYAAGDFTTLFADRGAFRPIGKARLRRG